jgi:hypothetical protein
MIRFIVALVFGPLVVFGQIRMSKLEIPQGKTFTITDTDIIVVDTLIMNDSSSIQLNVDKGTNYIHAKEFRAGVGTRILGEGHRGFYGKDGARGVTLDGPCLDGTAGRNGTNGSNGQDGMNLYLYFVTVDIKGPLTIEIGGGDGADAGKGGNGGGGSPGTRVCMGGNGGSGGNGGNGGNGGSGGNLTISCKVCPELRLWIGTRVIVRNYPGYAGMGGDGGFGGLAGLGSGGDSRKDGQIGQRGKKGADGVAGKQGSINFERN